MNKIIIYSFILFTILHGATFKIVSSYSVPLNYSKLCQLTLKEENYQGLVAEKSAKILIDYEVDGVKKYFNFIDNSKPFPIVYYDHMKLNTKINERVNLVGSINVFDINNDGKNEFFIYGKSYYGINGHIGKVIILHQTKNNIFESIGIVQATDLYEINYIKKENIIILAQAIMGSQLEELNSISHNYQFSIYEINNFFHKIDIYTTKEKYNDQNSLVIKDYLNKILLKYNAYKDIQGLK